MKHRKVQATAVIINEWFCILASNLNHMGSFLKLLKPMTGFTLYQLNHCLWRWSLAIGIFKTSLDVSNVKPSLRTNALNSSKNTKKVWKLSNTPGSNTWLLTWILLNNPGR